jgi:hypothetical protein
MPKKSSLRGNNLPKITKTPLKSDYPMGSSLTLATGEPQRANAPGGQAGGAVQGVEHVVANKWRGSAQSPLRPW